MQGKKDTRTTKLGIILSKASAQLWLSAPLHFCPSKSTGMPTSLAKLRTYCRHVFHRKQRSDCRHGSLEFLDDG